MVLLKPDDVKLTYGSPSVRRKFIDILISQLSSVYIDNLMRYGRVLCNKNALLSADKIDSRQLVVWNEKLVEYGSEIISKRLEIIDELKHVVNEMYKAISGKDETIEVKYHTISIDKSIESSLKQKLDASFEKEKRYKRAIVGPHRDDIGFLINGKHVGDFGSQGENKTFLISLKLAELSLLSKYVAEKPILLFDDIFSELDKGRIDRLMNYVKDLGQIFITTTDKHLVKKDEINYINIENGCLV